MNKKDKMLYKMIITAVFSALTFAGVYVHIPMPTGGFVHLGNFICIIAGLLCGGLVGGISGALGMGIYDIAIYYGTFNAGVLRTIVLKFGMGFIAGELFRFLLKKDKKIPNILNIVMFSVFTIGFILTLIASILGPFELKGGKTLSIHYIIPVFFGSISILYLFVIIFNKKLNQISKTALASISIAVTFNIFGEIFIKALFYYLFDLINSSGKYPTYEAAFIYSVSGVPSVLITSILTAILSSLIFYPLYNATRKVNRFDDIKYLVNIEDTKDDTILYDLDDNNETKD